MRLCPWEGTVWGGLSRAVSVQGVLCLGGLCLRGFLSRGVSVQEGLCQGDPPGQRPPGRNMWPETSPPKEHGTRQPDRKCHHIETPPPVNRMTDRQVQKHYLPTASFVCGKKIYNYNSFKFQHLCFYGIKILFNGIFKTNKWIVKRDRKPTPHRGLPCGQV